MLHFKKADCNGCILIFVQHKKKINARFIRLTYKKVKIADLDFEMTEKGYNHIDKMKI